MSRNRAPLNLGLAWMVGDAPPQPIDPRLFALLEAIRDTGKLTNATAQVGLPYRQAWGMIGKWSGIIGRPLVVKKQGRGTRLTPLGDRLVWLRERIGARLSPHLESAVSEVEQQMNGVLEELRPTLAVQASHDLALAELREFLRIQGGLELDVRFVGSLDSVAALSKGRCDLAGFHVPEGSAGSEIVATYHPWLKPRLQRLIHFVKRRQGLILPPGNPLRIGNFAEIVRSKARFINRQKGSGTRIAVERMLSEQGIDENDIAGFHTEEFTHLAVAAAVASGMADVGFGIEAAARKLRLHFTPLFTEDYYLLVRKDALDQESIQQLIAVLRGEDFRRIVAALPGYDGSAAGTVRAVDELA